MAGTAASRPKLAVLDTNVLFHLAEQYAPAHNLVLRLAQTGFTTVVVQTVVQELMDAADHGDTPKKRQLAAIALDSMLDDWGIQPMALKPVGNGICEIAANMIAGRGLLPEEERNDAYVLIESGICEATILVTWDSHLLDASNVDLNALLTSIHIGAVNIVHPRAILGY